MKLDDEKIILIARFVAFDVLNVFARRFETLNVVELARVFRKLQENEIMSIAACERRYRSSIRKNLRRKNIDALLAEEYHKIVTEAVSETKLK